METTGDFATRNALALDLAEKKAPGLEDVLVRLIERPALADQRGTLVRALSYYDCSAHLCLLVSLVAHGNWEVAHEALQALETIEEVDGDEAGQAFALMKNARAQKEPEDWRRELLSDLAEMFD